MTLSKKVEIPRSDGFNPAKLLEYHALMLSSVFPLVDELMRSGFAEGYDFLTHSSIDLRLWLRDDVDITVVQERLRAACLPDALVDFAPAETGPDRTRLLGILMRGAESVRALLEDAGAARQLYEPVHWFLNQYGLHNWQEVEFHERQAAAWKQQLNASS
jgi:hypothetical protein